jgi:hypothetical protein
MSALISVLLNFLTNSFSATRFILYGLFVLVLPVVLWNVWIEITEAVLSLLSGAFSSVNTPSSGLGFSFASFGSLAVWFASNLRLGEAFVAFISGLTIRLTVDVLMRVILR